MADSIYILERYEDLDGAAAVSVRRYCTSRGEAEAYIAGGHGQGGACFGYVLREAPLSSDLPGLPFVRVCAYLPDGALYCEMTATRLVKGPPEGELVAVFPRSGGSVSAEVVVESRDGPPRLVTVDRNGSASSPPSVVVFPLRGCDDAMREMLGQAAGRYRPHKMAKEW